MSIRDEPDSVLSSESGSLGLASLLPEDVEVRGVVRDSVNSGRARVELEQLRALEVDGRLSLGEDGGGIDRGLAVVFNGEKAERDVPERLVLLLSDVSRREESVLSKREFAVLDLS
jgi:hypothetical protein